MGIVAEAIEIYEKYFLQKYDVIRDVMDHYLHDGKKIAIWGAGLRGRAFLNAFDADNRRISCVFDWDEKKHGKILEFGHRIVDFREYEVDAIIIVNGKLEQEVSGMLKSIDKDVQIINVDNIILGNLSAKDVLFAGKLDIKRVRNVKVAAIVILYEPDVDVIENMKSYVQDLDRLYVYDNSTEINTEIERAICNFTNAEYYFAGENQGLCVPYNQYYRKAIEEGMDWFITLDQDSQAEKNMLCAMKDFANSDLCDEKIGIIAPVICDLNDEYIQQDMDYRYVSEVIQSGSMHRLDMMKIIGDYDENLFIDQIDYEYCARCRAGGYKVVKLNQAILFHDCQDKDTQHKLVDGKMIYFNKYSLLRYYYRYRNTLYCYDKYREKDPIYALDCQNFLRKTEMSIELEDDAEEEKNILQKAKYDFEHHIMGKRRDLHMI